jgi:hypothetical protein
VTELKKNVDDFKVGNVSISSKLSKSLDEITGTRKVSKCEKIAMLHNEQGI